VSDGGQRLSSGAALHQMRCCQAALCAVWIALSACTLASAELGSGPHSKHPEDVLLTISKDAQIKTDSDGVHLQVHLGANTLLSDAAVYILNVAGEKIEFHSGDLALPPPTTTQKTFCNPPIHPFLNPSGPMLSTSTSWTATGKSTWM
jgi:hypothetical protein